MHKKDTTLISKIKDSITNESEKNTPLVTVKLPLLNTLSYHNIHSSTQQTVVEIRKENKNTKIIASRRHPVKNMIYLHSYFLSFPHPITKLRVSFQDTVPDAWGRVFDGSIVNAINRNIAGLVKDQLDSQTDSDVSAATAAVDENKVSNDDIGSSSGGGSNSSSNSSVGL